MTLLCTALPGNGQVPQPYRENVWEAQRLEARRNMLQQKPNRLPFRRHSHRYRYLLVMSPDPTEQLAFFCFGNPTQGKVSF